jgi:5'-methylthioadenosine phosphorylase
VGTLRGRRVAFLARHARGHRLLPSELNSQANIFALKLLGVDAILSVSAVGSLKEKYAPLHLVVPDQLLDRTSQRRSTFFGRGLVAHVAFAHPFCPVVSETLAAAGDAAGATVHRGGTYVCIEGPQFSTRAESELYRAWGMDLVGMTNLQEATLAREAEICYATLAMVTDYDCWHPDHDSVTADQIIANLVQNAATAKSVLRGALDALPARPRRCECGRALKQALVTAPELVPEPVKKELAPIIGKYMK